MFIGKILHDEIKEIFRLKKHLGQENVEVWKYRFYIMLMSELKLRKGDILFEKIVCSCFILILSLFKEKESDVLLENITLDLSCEQSSIF
jgi:hypothetical protein